MKPVIVNRLLLEQAARLRHQFFAVEKGWVPCNEQGLELDGYDDAALHMGVENNGRLIAYMRVLRGNGASGYMLDKDFRACLHDDSYLQLERHYGVELSRRVVHPALSRESSLEAVELLFQMFCQYVLYNNIKAVYLVQEPSYTPMLRRFFGLNFKPLQAEPYQFPDGTRVEVVGAKTDELMKGLVESGRWPRYEAFMERFPVLFERSDESSELLLESSL